MNILQRIGIFLKANESIKNIKEAKMKTGYKTTEFWMVVIANLLNVLGTLNGVIDGKTFAIVSTTLNGAYTVMRTLAKNPEITTIIQKQ